MPRPDRRHNPTPDDLARDIAKRLAESGDGRTGPAKTGFAWRESVLVGRFISGSVVLTTAAVLIIGVFVGANWLVSRGSAVPPSVLAGAVDAAEAERAQPVDTVAQDQPGLILLGIPTTTTTTIGVGPVATPTPERSSPLPILPGSTTTTITTGPQSTTTTLGPTSSSAPTGVPTTSPTTTSPLPPTTTPSTTSSTTTTTTLPISTTTLPTTTTTPPTTTTTEPTTTTTCGGNNGGGNGSGPCGPEPPGPPGPP